MKLHFNPTSGLRALANAIKYVNDVKQRASDMRPFFQGLESDTIKELQHEFDASNPNKWKPISAKWLAQKTSEGRPENIGVYTGALMTASSEDAIKQYYPTGMTWKIAPVESIGFTYRRKIGITTQEWLRGVGKRMIYVILGKQ